MRKLLAVTLVLCAAAGAAAQGIVGSRVAIDLEKQRLIEALSELEQIRDADTFSRDDASDYSFVRQIGPILFGRRVRGYDELKVFADLIRETDRATFLNSVLHYQSPYFTEYVDHWSETLLDWWRVTRGLTDLKRMDRCIGRTDPPRSPASGFSLGNLARCVHANSPMQDCAVGQPFNLADLLRSALAMDNLAPAYRGYLFPLVAHTIEGAAEATAQNIRDDIGSTFSHVYIRRNLGCLQCHRTQASVSGERDINGDLSYWNRHFPIPYDFETAIYNSPSGRDSRTVYAIFRHDIARGSLRPWGMSECGEFSPPGTPTAPTAIVEVDGNPAKAYLAGNHGADGSVWELERTFKRGYDLLAAHGLRSARLRPRAREDCVDHCAAVATPPPVSASGASLESFVHTTCATCHSDPPGPEGPPAGLDLAGPDWEAAVVSQPATGRFCRDAKLDFYMVPDQPDQSCLVYVIENDLMPLGGGLSDSQKAMFTSFVMAQTAGAGCLPSRNICTMAADDDNEAALAYLVAANIVNMTWEQVMGSPLTVPNYFPRNEAQRDILWNLTENVFIANGWSLKHLLVAILTSDSFNRRSPQATTATSAYRVPPYAKPFEVNDPRFPPEALPGWTPGSGPPTPNLVHAVNHYRQEDGRSRHRNAMSDGIYRLSARDLLQSVHDALGWLGPPRLESGTAYPSDELRREIGQFYHDAQPGFRGVNFQALLAWEANHGTCANPGSGPDWIDRLIDQILNLPQGAALTHRDLVVTLKDWLLSDGTIDTFGEEATLETLFRPLDDPVDLSSAAAIAALEAPLRELCGVLLETPQFMLAGLAPDGLGPRPVLRVCNQAPCRYVQICDPLEDAVGAVTTRQLTCSAGSLEVAGRLPRVDPQDAMCPLLSCTPIGSGATPDFCLDDPMGCIPEPPPCDPRCARLDCCGGPMPPLSDARYYLGFAEGGLVERAEGVRVARFGRVKPVTLQKGTKLQAGDWLMLPPGSHVRIVSEAGTFQTPPDGAPKTGTGRGWHLLVSGPSVLSQRARLLEPSLVPKAAWVQSFEEAWLSGGAAGAPVEGEPFQAPNRPIPFDDKGQRPGDAGQCWENDP